MGITRPPSDEIIERMLASIPPCSLPPQAWGQERLEWPKDPAPVWVWISWPHRSAERLPGIALGVGERVCVVEIRPADGVAWQPVVWRNAVTRRG